MSSFPNTKSILLVGAGYANLEVVRRARHLQARGASLTLVNPDGYWYSSSMASEVISGHYGLADFRVDLQRLAERQGVNFIRDEMTALWPEQHRVLTRQGLSLPYDLLVLNLGSLPLQKEGDVPVDGAYSMWPIRNVLEIRNEVETLIELEPEKKLALLVLGGGASGVECALNLSALLKERAPAGGWQLTLLEEKGRILSAYSNRASYLVQRELERAGVEVRTGGAIMHVQSGRVVLERGEILDHDLAIVALGDRVSDMFSLAGLLTDEAGAVLVDHSLQVRDFPEIFAAGNCVRLWGLGLERLASHAIAQGRLLARNLAASLEDRPLRSYYRKAAPWQIISLGPRSGLAIKGRRVFAGRIWLWVKHLIDGWYLRRLRRLAGRGRVGDKNTPLPAGNQV